MYLKILNKLFKKFESFGVCQTQSGAMLVGKAEFIAPNAWLHKSYEPLSEEEIVELEKRLVTEIPYPYKQFLREANGCKIFNTTLSLDGYRRNYDRDEESVWQPFDIVLPNIDERITDAHDSIFFIGGYDWDGSVVYIDKITNQVLRCSREGVKPLNKWNNLQCFLEEEITRLIELFDAKGKEIDDDVPTTPPEDIFDSR